MLRRSHRGAPAAFLVAAVAMCASAAPVDAQVVERRDSVDGTLHVAPPCTGFPCIEQPRYAFRVVTEAGGSAAQGSITYLTGERSGISGIRGEVTCASVHGNRATVAADLDEETATPGQAPRSVIVFLEDNGAAAMDRFLVRELPLGTAPSTCPAPPAALGPGYPGPVLPDPGVTIVDLDSGPVFRFQCRHLGWVRYGFASRSECEAFVVRTRALAGSIREFPIPTAGSGPFDIAPGPDGALWFSEANSGKIGRITTYGSVREFPLSVRYSFPGSITAGSDGALWFTQAVAGNGIGRIDTTGAVRSLPTGSAGSFAGIASGSDGALWTTASVAGRQVIGRMTTAGTFTTFPLNVVAFGTDIAAGPDGALWFALYTSGVGRITTAGQFTSFASPSTDPGIAGITSGPGGLWFTDQRAVHQIGRITTGGQITLFPLPDGAGLPQSIAAGADGALWFTLLSTGQIGRLTPAGEFTALPLPTLDAAPVGIAAAPGGFLWFTEQSGNKIGRVPARPRNRAACSRLRWAALGFRSRQACRAFVEFLPAA